MMTVADASGRVHGTTSAEIVRVRGHLFEWVSGNQRLVYVRSARLELMYCLALHSAETTSSGL